MPRIQLPPGCFGFADGNRKVIAERGPGSFVNLDDGDPQIEKIRRQGYASAGLVDAGPEKFFVRRGPEGRWCRGCGTIWHSWTKVCERCRLETVPESEMTRKLPDGPYRP